MFQIKIETRRKKKLSKAKLQKYIYKQLVRLWKDCVQAFILETIKHIRVDTGMSRASLQPLGAQVGLRSLIIETLRGKGPKRIYNSYDFPGIKGKLKSRAHGEKLGKKAYTLKFGTQNNPQLIFEFHIVVLQHYLHESSAHYSKSKNWQSLTKGKEAFLDFWNQNFDKYISKKNIYNFFLTGNI